MEVSFYRGAACVGLALLISTASAQAEPLAPAQIAPDEVKWERGAMAGVMRANMSGDEQKPGMYVFRVRFPANFKVPPHFHPDERVVTILSGTLYVGYGERFDENAMKALPAGSIFTEPAKQPHFVWAKDGEVVIQTIGGNGPSGTTRIEQK